MNSAHAAKDRTDVTTAFFDRRRIDVVAIAFSACHSRVADDYMIVVRSAAAAVLKGVKVEGLDKREIGIAENVA